MQSSVLFSRFRVGLHATSVEKKSNCLGLSRNRSLISTTTELFPYPRATTGYDQSTGSIFTFLSAWEA